MSTKELRGTKRTCQSAACSARFYDLNRNPIVCPVCGTIYELMVTAPAAQAALPAEKIAKRPVKKPEVVDGDVVAPELEADDALGDIEVSEEAIEDAGDEAFLEPEEEDGGDVSGIIGGPVAEGEEET